MQTVAAPAPTTGDLRVRVVGHQWWFEYDYPDLNIVTANDLHIPVNTNVYFDLVSVDVIHSFWVPQLSGKIDVIPGQTNHLWFRADRPGEFSGQCAEYCGLNHANMRIKVVAQSQADFQAWVANQQKPPVAPQTDQQKQAQALLTNGLCITCHSFGGKAAINPVGPDLSHLYSRTTFAGSMFALTDDNLRKWLQNTQAMKPGNDMNITLTPEQIDALMAYLPTLK